MPLLWRRPHPDADGLSPSRLFELRRFLILIVLALGLAVPGIAQTQAGASWAPDSAAVADTSQARLAAEIQTASEGEAVAHTTSSTVLRASPRLASRTLQELPADFHVDLLSRNGRYWGVRISTPYGDIYGYVSDAALRPDHEATTLVTTGRDIEAEREAAREAARRRSAPRAEAPATPRYRTAPVQTQRVA